MESPSEAARRELLSWPGVTVHDHRFGGIEFRVNGREMGHMHGDELAVLSSILGGRLLSEISVFRIDQLSY